MEGISFIIGRPLYELIQGSSFELLERTAELVGTGCGFIATTDAVEAGDDIVDLLTTHQFADALQVAMTATKEKDLLDDIVLVGTDVNQF